MPQDEAPRRTWCASCGCRIWEDHSSFCQSEIDFDPVEWIDHDPTEDAKDVTSNDG